MSNIEQNFEIGKNKSLLDMSDVVDNTTNPIFLGKPLGLERYDTPKYDRFNKFYDEQFIMNWRPEEIPMAEDTVDYPKLIDHHKKLLKDNLGFQMLLDTAQSRGINFLLQSVTNQELARAFKIWEFYENIHSHSYTHIIRCVYPNPKEILDSIEVDENIKKRVDGVVKYYDAYINSLGDSLHDQKKTIWLTIVSIQILEAIRFYVSFACSYFFDYHLGKMRGNAQIIQLINRDENLHFMLTRDIIKILRDNKDEGFQEVIEETKDIVQQMWLDSANEEIAWAKYLFEENPSGYNGFNADSLTQFMKYRVNQQMKICGFHQIFEKVSNPFKWIDEYIKSDKVQNAPQENQNTAYNINATDSSNLGDFSDELDL